MSTFFEKLTSAQRPQNDTVNIAASAPAAKGEPKHIVRKSAPAPAPLTPELTQPHRLRVAEEEKPAPAPKAEEASEEEGELTVDIYDRGDSIVIQSTVAGVKPEDLDVAITNDTVTIRGRRERPEEVEDEHYYYKELFWGTFSRSVILPEEIEDNAAEALLKYGLLTIKLPKKKKGVVQKLKVKVT